MLNNFFIVKYILLLNKHFLDHIFYNHTKHEKYNLFDLDPCTGLTYNFNKKAFNERDIPSPADTGVK